MKPQKFISSFLIILMLLYKVHLQAQQSSCIFKDPMFKIDFGSGWSTPSVNISPLQHYKMVERTCPDDGFYSFVSNTSDCFNGDWLTFKQDHTGDRNGRMMLVNASPEGGIFFNTVIAGLKGNTTYKLSAALVNVCRISGSCEPLPPNIRMKLTTPEGQIIVTFHTGLLSQNATPHWKIFSGLFTTSANINKLILTMEDMTKGGCGNDFALDDIMIRECIKPTAPKPVVRQDLKPLIEAKKTVAKKMPESQVNKIPVKTSLLKKVAATAIKRQVADTPMSQLVIKQKTSALPPPEVISTRANPLIKQINTEPGEINIALYDNGQVDGDTVSIYHNNELIISRAGLSTKPVSFQIEIDPMHPYHELIMVANNLGSIPPNTSIMVITTGNKRYEVFISSTEQKNAKIVIGLKDKN